MATIERIDYVCDNCDNPVVEAAEVQHFQITYLDATHKVDLCADCATRVAWLHAKGTPTVKRGRPLGTPSLTANGKVRGRPRKIAVPEGTGTSEPPVLEAVAGTAKAVEVANPPVLRTVADLFGDGSTEAVEPTMEGDLAGTTGTLMAAPSFVEPNL